MMMMMMVRITTSGLGGSGHHHDGPILTFFTARRGKGCRHGRMGGGMFFMMEFFMAMVRVHGTSVSVASTVGRRGREGSSAGTLLGPLSRRHAKAGRGVKGVHCGCGPVCLLGRRQARRRRSAPSTIGRFVSQRCKSFPSFHSLATRWQRLRRCGRRSNSGRRFARRCHGRRS
jgi:hypothetical protein